MPDDIIKIKMEEGKNIYLEEGIFRIIYKDTESFDGQTTISLTLIDIESYNKNKMLEKEMDDIDREEINMHKDYLKKLKRKRTNRGKDEDN